MVWQWSFSVIAELAASTILLLLAIYFPWRDLNRQARLTGVTLVFFCALWILSHAIEIGFPVASYKERLVGVQLILGIMALTFWLFYILCYLGPRKLLAGRIYILFGIMPLIAILGLWANNVYGLMWTEPGLDSQNPYLPLQPTYGIIYWACMGYVAILMLTGSFLLIWNIIRRRYSYRRESIFLLAAAVLPLITAFIEVMGLLSNLKLSVGISSLTACIGAIILILNLPRFHLEQVIPIARDIVFERIGDCILVLDEQNRVLDLNPAAEQLTGYRISDAIGLSIEQIWPYQSTPMTSFNKMAKEGEELVLERDGKQRTYGLRISPIADPGGRLTSKVALLTDITGRKQVEEALSEKTRFTDNLINSIGDPIFVKDDSFRFILANNALCNMLGMERKKIIGKTLGESLPEDQMAHFLEVDEMVLKSGQENLCEEPLTGHDGNILTIVTRKTCYVDEHGSRFVVGVIRDITERKQAEDHLRFINTLLSTQNETSLDGILIVDEHGKIISYNQTFITLWLIPHDIAESRSDERALQSVMDKIIDPEGFIKLVNHLYENKGEKSRDEILLKDGRILDRFSSPMFSADRHYYGRVWYFRDITERRLSEEKLLKSYEALKKTLNDAIDTMAKIVETRDPYTAGHQHKVADLANAIAREMKLEDSRIDQLRMAAVIHDIGKMYVPSDILSKPGRLSDIEFSLIKTHPQSGYDIIKGMDFPCNIAKAVLQHHERLDGSGYPNQLKGEDTLLEAKILAVADVIEAMASHRPYRAALGIDKALEEISKNKGKFYDPAVVDACVNLFTEKGFKFKE